jgi:hypothetical protein
MTAVLGGGGGLFAGPIPPRGARPGSTLEQVRFLSSKLEPLKFASGRRGKVPSMSR